MSEAIERSPRGISSVGRYLPAVDMTKCDVRNDKDGESRDDNYGRVDMTGKNTVQPFISLLNRSG